MTDPRNWDVNGWCVDCLPGVVAPVRHHCAVCPFQATAASVAAADAAMWDHHRSVHLPNDIYQAHTQRQS